MAKKDDKPAGDPPKVEEPIEDMAPVGGESDMGEEDVGGVEDVEPAEDAPETPTLSAKEIEGIRAQARREVENEFKKKLRSKALAAEKKKIGEQLSMAENTHLNGVLSDLVRISINIPEFSNVPWIQFEQPHGQCYIHGQTYVVKRHVANQLRETMQYMRRHQNEIDGKSRNRQLPDGTFVDMASGARSHNRATAPAVADLTGGAA